MTYGYDDNGNLVAEQGGAATLAYAWDFDDKLTGITGGSSPVGFEYDADGAKIAASEGRVRTSYLIDDNLPYHEIIEERDASSQLKASYLHTDQLLGLTQAQGSFYVSRDHLGSTRGLTNDLGSLTDRFAYKAFGETNVLLPKFVGTTKLTVCRVFNSVPNYSTFGMLRHPISHIGLTTAQLPECLFSSSLIELFPAIEGIS